MKAATAGLRVALVGGVERSERAFVDAAAALGHRLDFHGGHLSGRGVDDLRRIVSRADVVIVATGVNSHGAAQLARKAARERGVTCVVVTSCNVTRLREILSGLEGGAR